MRLELTMAALLLFLVPAPLPAQRVRRVGPSSASATAPPLKGVIISVRGKLKELSRKSIMIQQEDNQIMTIRRSSRTQFFRGEKTIKPFDIDLESTVSIDVTEDNDLKLTAIAVRADPGQKAQPLGSR